MTTQQSDEDIVASLAHALTQRRRDAQKWQAQAGQWEAVVKRQRAELAALEAERDDLRVALIRWHDANDRIDFADADEDLAELARQLAEARGGQG